MKLEDIGFYTLSDKRAKEADHTTRLSRCEIILTDKCNFKCPYCRGLREDIKGVMPYEHAKEMVEYFISEKLYAIRFSGGEPTTYPRLNELVKLAKSGGIEKIAISTNGSANTNKYLELIDSGVNDFSISLDACCSSMAKTMNGGIDVFDVIKNNIEVLSKRVYVSVGVVLTEENMSKLEEVVNFAHSLGVKDIRIIPSSQHNKLKKEINIDDNVLEEHKILKYRIENIKKGLPVRGIGISDTKKCPLVLDDMAIAGLYHFPCIIYMREQGNPVGTTQNTKTIRKERLDWYRSHNCQEDSICRKNCLDVCVAYNNKWEKYQRETNLENRRLV